MDDQMCVLEVVLIHFQPTSSTSTSNPCLDQRYQKFTRSQYVQVVTVIIHVMQLSSLIVPVKVLCLYIPQCIVTVMIYIMQHSLIIVPEKVIFLQFPQHAVKVIMHVMQLSSLIVPVIRSRLEVLEVDQKFIRSHQKYQKQTTSLLEVIKSTRSRLKN